MTAVTALGLALGLGACGGTTPTAAPPAPTPTPTPAPARLEDLSASVSSPESGKSIGCQDDVHVRITLTNRSGSSVQATGAQLRPATQSRECSAGDDYIYRGQFPFAVPNATTVLFESRLYSKGSGCCDNPKKCGGECDFEDTLSVLTPLGEVPAGTIAYNVAFSSACSACAASANGAGGRSACRRIALP